MMDRERAKQAAARAGEAATTFGRFVWHDVKATLRVFVKVGGAALALGTLAVLVVAWAGSARPPAGQSPAVTYAVWLLAAMYYAALPAALVGGVAATWRHFGWTTLLPLVVLPLMTALVFTLGGGIVVGAARGLADAFMTAARAYNWPAVQGFGRLAHAGPVAIPFVLAAALFDGLHLLGDGRVAGSLVKLLFVVSVLGAVSLLGTVGATAPPMAWVFVRRARARWAAWREGAA